MSDPAVVVDTTTRASATASMMTSSPSLSAHDQCLWSYCRLAGSLVLHSIVIAAELFAIFFFSLTRNIVMDIILITPFILSGFLCSIAAWHTETPFLGRSCLPLSKRPIIVGMLLAVPLGLFQGVIVVLELEDFYARRRSSSITSSGGLRQRFNDALRNDQSWLDKFHCKAVNGVFEGLAFAGVVFFGYLGVDYPKLDPITKLPDGWDPDVTAGTLQAVLWICFFSVGLCLLELDSAVSPRRVRKKMKSCKYELYHFIFRLCEVVSRWSLLIAFLILTRRRLCWWWALLVFELVLSVFLVDLYGGCEVTMLVRVMCATPCVCADVFRFVDSPYKRRAAQKLSRAFVIRNAVETIALPALYFFNLEATNDVLWLIRMHHSSLVCALISHPVYWFSLWCINSSSKPKRAEYRDIFSACEAGDLSDVMAFTSEARFGINMNIFDIDGKTPLMLTVERCSAGMDESREAATAAAICSLLVEEGARVDLPIFEDNRLLWNRLHRPMRLRWTALHLAAWQGCHPVVEALVESERNFGASFDSGTDIDLLYLDKHGDTPLHIAAARGNVDVVRVLLATWPRWATLKNRRGKSPIDLTASEEIQRVLREEGVTASGETPLLPSPDVSLGVATRRGSDAQNWQSVRLPILHNFRDKAGPCRAPGLSSYVASIGGGALGKAFLVEEIMLQTIDENSILSTLNTSVRRPDLNSNLNSSSVATESWVTESVVTSSSASLAPVTGPMLEDLEPIDSHGHVIDIWRNMVQEAERQGQPLGAFAFQFLDPRCVIGAGSFGTVWRAQDRTSQVKYAVKNMRSQRDEVSPLAQRELDMSNHVRLQPHPCIVTFHQIFAFPGFCMIVMEFCPRGDLLHQIREARKEAAAMEAAYAPPALAQRWIGQIFLALEHLHLKMLSMLRDLKPENVVLSDRGIAKLTDFGFGRGDVESNGTWTFGMPPGSPGYIAPESLLQQQYDCRSDLFSYGVVIWVLLTGGVKYDAEPRPPVGVKKSRSDYKAHAHDWYHLHQCIESPEQYQACPLPPIAVDLVTRLTQKRQADRPQHPQIRQYPLLQELGLPELCHSPTAVNAWLAASEDGSSSSRTPASASSRTD